MPLSQLPLSEHRSAEADGCCADQQDSSDAETCVHSWPGTAVILLSSSFLAMPSHRPYGRPGRSQRWRTWSALTLALLVWALRWIWPLQLLPGWFVAVLFAWAGLELIGVLWFPQRSN